MSTNSLTCRALNSLCSLKSTRWPTFYTCPFLCKATARHVNVSNRSGAGIAESPATCLSCIFWRRPDDFNETQAKCEHHTREDQVQACPPAAPNGSKISTCTPDGRTRSFFFFFASIKATTWLKLTHMQLSFSSEGQSGQLWTYFRWIAGAHVWLHEPELTPNSAKWLISPLICVSVKGLSKGLEHV